MRFRFLLFSSLCLVSPPGAAATLDDAVALHKEGKLDEALAVYREVAASSVDASEVASAHNNACVLLTDRGEHAAALGDCREAVRLRRRSDDPLALAQSLNNLALALTGIGSSAEAESALREALSLDRAAGLDEEAAVDLANLAALHIDTARYGRALDTLAETETLLDRNQQADWAAEQRRIARINRAVVLERLGAWKESLDLLRDLADVDQQPDERATLLIDLGVDYRNLGDPRTAQRRFREALAIFGRTGDRAAMANAWLNIGLAHEIDLERPQDARKAYEKALELAEGGDRDSQTQALIRLARLAADAGDGAHADELAARAHELAREANDGEGIWAALDAGARASLAAGDGERALERFGESISALERVHAGAGSQRMRAGFLVDKRELFATAIDLAASRAVASGDSAQTLAALAIVERAKARDLLDAVGSGGSPLDAASLAALAQQPRTLVEFALGERRLWRFALGHGEIALRELGDTAEIVRAGTAARARLMAGGSFDPGSELGDTLLGGMPGLRGEVVIAPDGALRYLPFDLLRVAGRRLFEIAEVTTLPSLSFVAHGATTEPVRAPALGLLALAPSAVAPPDPRSRAGLLAARFELPPLPASTGEIAALARLLTPAAAVSGAEATERRLRDQTRSGVRVLHLAAHTVLDERLGDQGVAIFLAPGAGTGSEDDGLLEPSEIARLPLDGTLTLLAGCSTALGTARDGRAQSSLVGSFLIAGSSGVVATLWDVGDEATATFMRQLGSELARGLRPAAALRATKRRFAATPGWESPRLWGAFVLFGDAPPVAGNRLRTLVGLATFAVTLALGLAAYRSWRLGAGSTMRNAPVSDVPSSRPDAS